MVCERHDEVMDCLDDHEDRIKYLELADTETKTEIKNLIKQIDKLVTTIEKFMDKTASNTMKALLGIATFGIGFVIWYIQTL